MLRLRRTSRLASCLPLRPALPLGKCSCETPTRPEAPNSSSTISSLDGMLEFSSRSTSSSRIRRVCARRRIRRSSRSKSGWILSTSGGSGTLRTCKRSSRHSIIAATFGIAQPGSRKTTTALLPFLVIPASFVTAQVSSSRCSVLLLSGTDETGGSTSGHVSLLFFFFFSSVPFQLSRALGSGCSQLCQFPL